MNTPDELLGPLRRKDGDPVFDEAWQAQALAMADTLVKKGTFSAEEWAATLGAELRSAADTGEPDNTQTYYLAVLRSLEILLDKSGTAVRLEVDAQQEEWKQAYLSTPHGQPVELSAKKI